MGHRQCFSSFTQLLITFFLSHCLQGSKLPSISPLNSIISGYSPIQSLLPYTKLYWSFPHFWASKLDVKQFTNNKVGFHSNSIELNDIAIRLGFQLYDIWYVIWFYCRLVYAFDFNLYIQFMINRSCYFFRIFESFIRVFYHLLKTWLTFFFLSPHNLKFQLLVLSYQVQSPQSW